MTLLLGMTIFGESPAADIRSAAGGLRRVRLDPHFLLRAAFPAPAVVFLRPFLIFAVSVFSADFFGFFALAMAYSPVG